MNASKIKKILSLLRELNFDEFREQSLTAGNSLDDVLEELKHLHKKCVSDKEKTKQIIEHITKFNEGDFLSYLPISEDEDKMDVIAMGLNTFGEELRENAISIQAFDDVFNSLQSPFFIIDCQEKVITRCNKATLDFFNYTGENKYRIPVTQLFDENLVGQIMVFCKNDNLLNNTIQHSFGEGGQQKHLVINFSKLSSAYYSRPSMSVFVTDITAQFEKEKLKNEKELLTKSLKFKDEFLAHMSHEIRTPLTVVMGMTDVLLYDTSLNNGHKEQLKTIKRASEDLLSIINDVLDLSKIEAGKMRLLPSSTCVYKVAKELEATFTQLARQKSLDFSVEFSSDKQVYVYLDKKRLFQILNNLVGNALKFTESGEVRVYMNVERSGENLMLYVTVKDSGIGITKEEQKLLFQKFSQVDSGFSRAYQGTGLGLAISKKFVELMNGEIGVKSIPGKGSEFWFYVKGKAGTADVSGKEESVTHKSLSGLSVLVVDDTSMNLMVTALMLEKFGCLVDTASHGEEVFRKVEQRHYDIIFMDIQMPEMDGITVLRKLKEQYEELPVVVALTANAIEGDQKKYLSSGFNDYLSKPIDRRAMISVLEKIALNKTG